jgi:hypothetical protein
MVARRKTLPYLPIQHNLKERLVDGYQPKVKELQVKIKSVIICDYVQTP